MSADRIREYERICRKISGERLDHFANPRVQKIYASDPASLIRRREEARTLAAAADQFAIYAAELERRAAK